MTPDKDAEEIIDRLESKRRANNKNWMDLVRLAFRVAPEEAKLIMAQICEKDAEIMEEARKLT